MTPRSLPLTPAQTVGPFFALGLHWPDGSYVVPADTADAFWLRGRVLDGAGEPVPDALVETWQADRLGRFDHPDDPRLSLIAGHPPDNGLSPRGFRGFGRCPTNDQGWYEIRTVKPGPVPAPDGRHQAAHIDISVFARGLLDRLVTRVYFADERAANAADPVLSAIPEPQRRTLLAHAGANGYLFDIRLQGDNETVFFTV